jgi:SAM-dependent methyltransferase
VLRAADLSAGYYNEPAPELAARSRAAKEERFVEYEALLANMFSRPGRVLDVGCNAGELLQLFQQRGWSVAGVEASPGPAAYAQKTLHSTIWQGPVEQVLPAEEQFDLITMCHVLEHIEHPAQVLQRLRSALLPGGAMLIEVPNAGDLWLRVWGGLYRPLCPGDHVSFFDANSIRRLLEEQRFSVLDLISPIHARDVLYPSLLSAVDWARSAARQGHSGADSGVASQTRYRGRFRRPLQNILDRCVRAADPAVVALSRRMSADWKGPVIIVTAREQSKADD